MAQLNYHPAPGLGDLLPGFFVVPQNPIQPVTYTPRIGEIMPGSFSVPQNPLKDYVTGNVRLIGTGNGVSGCGCGGGCGSCNTNGKINGMSIAGINGISEDWDNIKSEFNQGDYMGLLQAPVFGIPLWGIAAGLVALMLVGGEEHSYYGRSRRAAKAAARAF